MPDYANAPVERKTPFVNRLTTSDYPFRINKEKGTYTVFPEGEQGAQYEYWPTESGGIPDLRSITVKGEPVGAETSILDLPQQDYDLGRAAIRRQFLDDMRMAENFKTFSPETYMALLEEARNTMQSRLARLENNYNRTELQFKQINQRPDISKREAIEAMEEYYYKNPVYKPPSIKAARAKTPLQVFREEAEREASGGVGLLPTEAPATAAMPAATSAIPPKPIGYPDAIWNEQLKSWTIIKDGKLMIWRP